MHDASTFRQLERVWIATNAFEFFGLNRTAEHARLADAPYSAEAFHPWTVRHFLTYLRRIEDRPVTLPEVTRVLGAMERAGLLVPEGHQGGDSLGGQVFYGARATVSQRRDGSLLWLAEAFGAELIIPSYASVTVQVIGASSANGDDEVWGTGLALGLRHVVTNRHVVEQMRADITVVWRGLSGEESRVARVSGVHDTLDVAVLEIEPKPREGGLALLPGMVFRDPTWADETFVFGYPRVPMTAEMAITVQRGEVVNPSTPSMPSRDPIFLFSAIARPGNSGGPIVASDGRVIGLVVEDSADTTSTDGAPSAAPFFRGIPSSEVLRALDDLGFGDLAELETWQ